MAQSTRSLLIQGDSDEATSASGFPVRVAGMDAGGVLRTLRVDASNNLMVNASGGTGTGATQVQGTAADGAAPVGNPVQVAGFDGTNIQTLLTDTSGRQQVVGAAAAGTAIAGNPVLIGGSDGTNARALSVDTTGKQHVLAQGENADGGTLTNPIPIGGMTGTTTVSTQRIANVFKNIAAVALTAGTPITVWTPAAGKKFRLLGWNLSSTSQTAFIFIDQATEVLRSGVQPLQTAQISAPLGNGLLSTAANNVLKLDGTASGTINGYVFGIEE